MWYHARVSGSQEHRNTSSLEDIVASLRWVQWLRDGLWAVHAAPVKLAQAYRDAVSDDPSLRNDGRKMKDTTRRAQPPKKEVAQWLRGTIPGKTASWRVGEALARLGLPFTGIDGLIAAGYEAEAVALVGSILARWDADRWGAHSSAAHVKRGLGLVAARAVGFNRLTMLPDPLLESMSALAREKGYDAYDLYEFVFLRKTGGPDRVSADVAEAWAHRLKEFSEALFLERRAAFDFENVRAEIEAQERENAESLRALCIASRTLTQEWHEWRKASDGLRHVSDPYIIAYYGLRQKSDTGREIARLALAGYDYAFGMERIPLTSRPHANETICDPKFPRFDLILQQMRERQLLEMNRSSEDRPANG